MVKTKVSSVSCHLLLLVGLSRPRLRRQLSASLKDSLEWSWKKKSSNLVVQAHSMLA